MLTCRDQKLGQLVPEAPKSVVDAFRGKARILVEREPCRSPAMSNGRCRMHGGPSPGAPKGNKNALRHGHYSAEAIHRRRRLGALIRASKSLSSKVGLI